MRLSIKDILLLILTFLWLGVLLYLSHQNGEQTAVTSLSLAERLLGWMGDISEEALYALNDKLRKAAHVFLYLVLAILVMFLFQRLWRGHTGIAVILLALIAIFDELTKIPIDGRHASLLDTGLNLLGAVIGTAIALLVKFIANRRCKAG